MSKKERIHNERLLICGLMQHPNALELRFLKVLYYTDFVSKHWGKVFDLICQIYNQWKRVVLGQKLGVVAGECPTIQSFAEVLPETAALKELTAQETNEIARDILCNCERNNG